jgi:phosphonate transport system ATP-binding protein
MSSVILSVHGLAKRFGHVQALDNVSFDLRPGEFTVLLGPSGSGKSTLFKCITRLVTPDAGAVALKGQDLAGLDGPERRRRLRDVGLIFQQFNLVERVSAIDNVLVGRLGHVATWRVALRCFTAAERQRALEALETVGLLDKAYQRADSLSGGQQQRVAIARVLAQGCGLVLADEPVASLDPQTARNVLGTLREATRKADIAVLCSLHQLEYARDYADRVIALRDGAVVLDQPARTLHDTAFDAIYGCAA